MGSTHQESSQNLTFVHIPYYALFTTIMIVEDKCAKLALKELLEPIHNASHTVFMAVRQLMVAMEEVEEKVLRAKLPEVELTEKELTELDEGVREIRGGEYLTLGEFNRKDDALRSKSS